MALAVWVLSLCLPVFEEGGAGRGNFIYGYSVLLFTFTWGFFIGIGIPWAAMNLGLLILFGMNLAGRSSRKLAALFSTVAALLTIVVLVLARDYPQWDWTAADSLQIGFLSWTVAMFLMAMATYIPCASAE